MQSLLGMSLTLIVATLISLPALATQAHWKNKKDFHSSIKNTIEKLHNNKNFASKKDLLGNLIDKTKEDLFFYTNKKTISETEKQLTFYQDELITELNYSEVQIDSIEKKLCPNILSRLSKLKERSKSFLLIKKLCL